MQAMASNLRHGQDSKDEQGANARADSWMTGLLAGDRAVVDLIDSMPPHWQDLQRIRQLVRRCRQARAFVCICMLEVDSMALLVLRGATENFYLMQCMTRKN